MSISGVFPKLLCVVLLLLATVTTASTISTTTKEPVLRTRNVLLKTLQATELQPPAHETLPIKISKKTYNAKTRISPSNPMILNQSNSRKEEERQRYRNLAEMEDYFTDMDIESLEEGAAVGAALMLLLVVICLLCCCCSMCCGGGRYGGGGCSLMDILAAFCCYEMFCDDSPGCFVPMDGEMC